LSVAADIAFTRSLVASSSLPCCFSAAATPSARPAAAPSADGPRRRQAKRGKICRRQIDDQQPPGRRAAHAGDQRTRALLQAVAFEQPITGRTM
jgi:hypothetical protein